MLSENAYSRPVTLPDLMKGQELQEINVLIRSRGGLGPGARDRHGRRCPSASPEGAACWNSSKTSSFCRSLTDPLIKPLAQAVNAAMVRLL